MGQYDGAVRINTAVNTDSFNKGMDRMARAMESLSAKMEKLGRTIETAFHGYLRTVQNTGGEVDRLEQSVSRANEETQTLTNTARETAEAYREAEKAASDFSDKAKQAGQDGAAAGIGENISDQIEKELSGVSQTAAGDELSAFNSQFRQAQSELEKYNETLNESGRTEQEQIATARLLMDAYSQLADRFQVLRTRLQAMSDSGEIQLDENSVAQTIQTLRDLEQQARTTYAQLSQYAPEDTGVEKQSEEAKQLEKELEKAGIALDRYAAKVEKMNALGATDRQWKSVDYDINKAAEDLQSLYERLQDLRASGKIDTSEYESLLAIIQELREKGGQIPLRIEVDNTGNIDVATEIEETAEEIEEVNDAAERTPTLFSSLGNSIKKSASAAAAFAGTRLASVLSGIATSALRASPAMLLMGRSAKKSGKSVGDSLLTFVKYSIGIRSVYMLVRKVISFIKEGMNNLVQFSDRANQSMSSLMSSMTRLKNSFATAFMPILEEIEPVITSLIDEISSAATDVGMLFSALTGKTTMTKAVEVQEDYAASLKGTAKEAKETKRQLAGFDELNILKDKDDGKVDPSDMFEEVPVELPAQMEKLKDAFQDMAKVAKQAWKDSGGSLTDAWKRARDTLRGLLQDIAGDFYRVFTDGYGYAWLVSLFGLLTAILDVIAAIGGAFRTAWNDGNRGYNYIASIFIMFTAINNLLAAIARTFVEAWNSGIGVEIAKNLLEIWTNIHLIIANLADGIRRAWEDTGLGVSIWTSILTIVNDVLSAVNRMTRVTVDWSSNLNFEPLFAAADKFLRALEPLVALISDGLAWCYENVLLPLSKWTIEEAAPALIELLATALDVLTAAINLLKPVALWLWENFLQPLAAWTGEIFIDAIQTITGALEKLADFLNGETSFSEFIDSLSRGEAILVAFATAALGLYAVNTVLGLFSAIAGTASGAVKILGTAASTATGQITAFSVAGHTALSGAAAIFAQAALAVTDALLLAYDFVALKNASQDYHDAQEAHNQETRIAMEQFERVYREMGPKAAEEWAKTVYDIDTSGKTLEEAQAALAEKVDTLWDDVPQNMWDGFRQGWSAYFGEGGEGLFALLGDSFTGAVDGVRNLLKIHSPSGVFDDIGQNSALGYTQGFKTQWPGLTAFLTGAFADMKKKFTETGKNIENEAGKNWTSIKSTISKKATEIKSDTAAKLRELVVSAKSQWEAVRTEAVNSWNGIRSSVVSSASGIRSQVVSTFQSMQSTLSGVWSGIRSAASGAMSSVSGMVSSMASSIASRVTSIRSTVSSITSSASSALEKVADKMDDLTRKTANKATATVSASFSSGGVVYNSGRASWWNSVKKYAAGTARAHGTLFAAGEAGPEIVGHVNGKTEILNESQIAAVIYTAVLTAMQTALNSFNPFLSQLAASSTGTIVEAVSRIESLQIEIPAAGADAAMLSRVEALSAVPYQTPAFATGTVMPYEVVAEIRKQTGELKSAIYENGQIVISSIVSAISNHGLALSDVIRAISLNQGQNYSPDYLAKYTIDEINRQTRMMGKSPLLS